jgi:hypothetical protein
MLAAFSITPLGAGESVSGPVADTVRLVRESHLPNETRAQVLADRGDANKARTHAATALHIGTEIGMTGPQGVVPRSQALLDQL